MAKVKGTNLNAALGCFWENIHFGRVVVWYAVNPMIIHISKASIPPSSHYSIYLFFKSSWCKIDSGARNLINSVHLKQRRPLPPLMSLSFFYGSHCLRQSGGEGGFRQCRTITIRFMTCAYGRGYWQCRTKIITSGIYDCAYCLRQSGCGERGYWQCRTKIITTRFCNHVHIVSGKVEEEGVVGGWCIGSAGLK